MKAKRRFAAYESYYLKRRLAKVWARGWVWARVKA